MPYAYSCVGNLFSAFEYVADSEITSITHGSEEDLLDKVSLEHTTKRYMKPETFSNILLLDNFAG